MNRPRFTSLAVILAAIACGGAIALQYRAPSGASAAAPVRFDSPRVLIAPGLVESERAPVVLAFEAAGRVAEILVDEGARVTAGEAVARLDDRAARARLARAEAALAAARAHLDMVQHGAERDEIAAARHEARAARATAAERATARSRAERLAGTGAMPRAEADAEVAAAKVAAANAAVARARLRLLKRGTRAELRRVAEAELAAATAEVEAAQVDLDHTVLRAPNPGIVLRRFAEVGALVGTATPTPIISIANLSGMRLRAEIDEADLGRVAIGQSGWATAPALSEHRLTGTVVRLTRELGRKNVWVEDPRARVDTRVLEVIFVFAPDAGSEELPLGLRMELHLPAVALARK